MRYLTFKVGLCDNSVWHELFNVQSGYNFKWSVSSLWHELVNVRSHHMVSFKFQLCGLTKCVSGESEEQEC